MVLFTSHRNIREFLQGLTAVDINDFVNYVVIFDVQTKGKQTRS